MRPGFSIASLDKLLSSCLRFMVYDRSKAAAPQHYCATKPRCCINIG
jgi:hypothetical protein